MFMELTLPESFGISPSMEARSEDFPEPTLPTTVTRAPCGICRFMFVRVGVSASRSQVKEALSTFTAGLDASNGSLTTDPSSSS